MLIFWLILPCGPVGTPTFRRNILYPSSEQNVETVCFSETLVCTYKSTPRYNPEDQRQHLHIRQNLNSSIITYG